MTQTKRAHHEIKVTRGKRKLLLEVSLAESNPHAGLASLLSSQCQHVGRLVNRGNIGTELREIESPPPGPSRDIECAQRRR
jgi:hypothetical protein